MNRKIKNLIKDIHARVTADEDAVDIYEDEQFNQAAEVADLAELTTRQFALLRKGGVLRNDDEVDAFDANTN